MTTSGAEFRPVQMMDGSYDVVPVFLDDSRREIPETPALLAAAAIIGAVVNVAEEEDGLQGLVKHVEATIGDKDGEVSGLIIEDELGAGSVIVDPDESTVVIREQEERTLPTPLLLDMLHAWNAKREEHRATVEEFSQLLGRSALDDLDK